MTQNQLKLKRQIINIRANYSLTPDAKAAQLAPLRELWRLENEKSIPLTCP
jgi:hypothetical protein